MRQEGGGMLIGTYERPACRGRERETPWDFGHELLRQRPRPHRADPRSRLRSISRRSDAPASSKVVNGPFTFAPDGNPLVGPVRGLQQLLGRLRRHGRLQPGRRRRPGAGELDGRTAIRAPTSGRMDVARYGDWATMAYTNAKVRENYSRRFRIRFPNEELPAARPLAHDAGL